MFCSLFLSTPKSYVVTLYFVEDTDNVPSGDHSQKHYFESRISREYRFRNEPYHDLLGVRATDATSIEPRWRHMIGMNSLPWLEHHLIDSQAVFPGSGYLCMAIEAMRQVQRERHPQQQLVTIALRDVSFLRGLVVPDLPGQRTEVQLSFTPQPDALFTFNFRITAHWDGEWHEHCRGSIQGTLATSDGQEEVDGIQLAHLASGVQTELSSEAISIGSNELYRELTEAGNVYGPTFRRIRSYRLEVDNSAATAAIEIPDTASIMPAQHQQAHLIHPTTLDVVLHTCLPMVSHHLGRGSIMPVHISEILVCATTEMPSEPSSKLDVSTIMRSSHFRTAHTDVCVTAHGKTLLVASGVEMRSLAADPSPGDAITEDGGICYELDWRPDLEFLRAQDLTSSPNLTQIIRHVLYKSANLSALEIGASNVQLSLAFLGCLDGRESSWPEYEYAAESSTIHEKARRQFVGYPVRYRTITTDSDVCDQGFKLHSYGVVLVSTLPFLGQARRLVDPNGVVIMELKSKPDKDWASLLHEAHLAIQLSVYDTVRNSMVILARPMNLDEVVKLPQSITILTHTDGVGSSGQQWVAEIEHWLLAKSSTVSREPLRANKTVVDPDAGGRGTEHCFIVVEDQTNPILSDPSCFGTIISLLKQPCRIVWLSPNDPPPMHQITGVARTAHAENENLRLTTVHVEPQLLSARDGNSTRLFEILALTLDPKGTSQEREYMVNKAGTVLIPRLLPENSLNHAIRKDTAGSHEVERVRFLDTSRTFALSAGDPGHLSGVSPATFHEIDRRPDTLANDEIELETRAFVLSKAGLKASHCAYTGIITRVGATVKHLSVGDHVVAISTTIGVNRSIIPQDHVGRVPPGIPPEVGARTILHIMAAYHALHGLAHLPSNGKVLIHGALTAAGRATLAVARSVGAAVAVSAAGHEDARFMTEELQISPDHVVLMRQSRSPKNVLVGDVDVIIQADAEDVPPQILEYLRPFGSVVVLGESNLDKPGRLSNLNLPRNSAVFFCDILGLLSERPDLASGLVAQAAATLSHLPFFGLDDCVRPIQHAAKVLRLIETGVCESVLLQADDSPIIQVALHPHSNTDWNTKDASYLITGGLGDLGRRLLGLMAQRGAKHLITLSRRACSVEDHRELQEQLRATSPGCNLHCLTCDITQEESVRQAAERLHELGVPPVRGIVQSAALLKVCILLPNQKRLAHCVWGYQRLVSNWHRTEHWTQ